MRYLQIILGQLFLYFGIILVIGFSAQRKPIKSFDIAMLVLFAFLPIIFGIITINRNAKELYYKEDPDLKKTSLAYFLFFFSSHRFYLYGIGNGWLYLLTMGGFGFWSMYDLLTLPFQVSAINNQTRSKTVQRNEEIIFQNKETPAISNRNKKTSVLWLDRKAGVMLYYISFIALYDSKKTLSENIKIFLNGLKIIDSNPDWGFESIETWLKRDNFF